MKSQLSPLIKFTCYYLHMKKSARYVLQYGLGLTFFVIGILILQDPMGWGSLIQPWAMNILGDSLVSTMKNTAYLDLLIGVLFLFRRTTWVAAFLGAGHLLIVIVTVGLAGASIVIRDIGLFAACLAMLLETIPAGVVNRIAFWKKQGY